MARFLEPYVKIKLISKISQISKASKTSFRKTSYRLVSDTVTNSTSFPMEGLCPALSHVNQTETCDKWIYDAQFYTCTIVNQVRSLHLFI